MRRVSPVSEGAAALSQPLFTPTGIERSLRFADRSFSILHGSYWLLNNLADGGPVAIAVDDLHWSDADSLRFLNYLSPRLDGLRVVVIASTRSGARSTELTRLAASPEATELRPAPLSVDATATLCARVLGAAVRLGEAAHRRDVLDPRSGADVVHEDQRGALPRSAEASVVGPELLDDLGA